MAHTLQATNGTTGGVDAGAAHGVIDRIDPRARILAAGAYALAVVTLSDLPVLALALAFSAALMVIARLPPGPTLRRMAAMDSFIVLMLAMLPFTVPGDAMFDVFGHAASWQGLRQAAAIALKANAIILGLMCLVGTMEQVTLGHALHRLRVPETLVHLLLFTVRYIDVLGQEYRRLRAAMTCRGFRPANSFHTYRTFGYLIGMMLVRAVERSERILDAMKCRGFCGRIPLLDTFRYRAIDAWFAAATSALLTLLGALEVVACAR